MKKEKIVLGMSGGVDSSVAALLLQRDGYDVEGVFMKNWDDKHAICSAEDDYADALSVSKKLNIPLHKIDYTKSYKNKVFKQFLDDHLEGFTPNPDVIVNDSFNVCAITQPYELNLPQANISSSLSSSYPILSVSTFK